MFQKYRSQLKILGAKRLKWSKFNTGPTNTRLQGTKSSHPGYAHPCSKYYQTRINFTNCVHN